MHLGAWFEMPLLARMRDAASLSQVARREPRTAVTGCAASRIAITGADVSGGYVGADRRLATERCPLLLASRDDCLGQSWEPSCHFGLRLMRCYAAQVFGGIA